MTDKDKYQNILACLFSIMYYDTGPQLVLIKLLSNFLQNLFGQGCHTSREIRYIERSSFIVRHPCIETGPKIIVRIFANKNPEAFVTVINSRVV
jgi:hypothetical protein